MYIPTTYQSSGDLMQLGTQWLGYIPTPLVSTLAAQIKVKNSPFYTGTDGVAAELAQHVNSGYAINSVPASSGVAGTNADGTAVGAVAAAAQQSKTRQDAIIGVVSALGAVALLVLVFLVFRSMRHKRLLAHRRLSDPPMGQSEWEAAGARPEGREFDQDSLGAPRRRSFYFAEDSLRGYAEATGAGPGAQGAAPGTDRMDEDRWDARPVQQMSQRRNVVPAAISAPILRESSMNW